MTHNEDITRFSSSLEDSEAVKRSMLSTIEKLQNETEFIFADVESALTAAKAVRMVSFKKEDMCQPDPIAHDYDNMDDNLRKETLQSYADRLTEANRESAMSNQRCAFAEKKLALSEAGQRRSREIIRTFRSKVKEMLEDAADQCERIVCVQQLSEKPTVANDDRQKIIKQRDLFSEQLKEERRKNQLLEDQISKLKKKFADVVEEKMELLQLEGELSDLKNKSDKNDRDLKRIRKERDDLKQENSRILREQKRLTTEYENKFEKMDKECSELLLAAAKKMKSTVENARIKQLVEKSDYYYKEYMKLLNSNEKKGLLQKQVQRLTKNYCDAVKDLHGINRDVEWNQLTMNFFNALKDFQKKSQDVGSNAEEIRQIAALVYHDEMNDVCQKICSTTESSENNSSAEPSPNSTNQRRSMSRNPPKIQSKFPCL